MARSTWSVLIAPNLARTSVAKSRFRHLGGNVSGKSFRRPLVSGSRFMLRAVLARRRLIMKSGVLTIILAIVPSALMASHLCWIDMVVPRADGLEVMFVASQAPRLFSLERSGKRLDLREADRSGPLVLREGDVAVIHQGAHDFCTLKVERRDGVVGLLVEARNRAHGLPPTDASEFVKPDQASR